MGDDVGQPGDAMDDLPVAAADEIEIVAHRPAGGGEDGAVGRHRHGVEFAVVPGGRRWAEDSQLAAADGVPDACALVFGRGDEVTAAAVTPQRADRRDVRAGFDA